MPVGPQGPRHSPFNRAVPWPQVGGPDLVVSATNLFLTPEFQDVYRPGLTRLIYVGATPGLADRAKELAMPVYNISTTSPDRLAARIEEKRRDQYGAWRWIDGNWAWRPGFDGWFPSQIHPCGQRSPDSPVQAGVRGITVRLPDGMTPKEFDDEFDAMTKHGALDAWSETEAGRQYCIARGIDPDSLKMATLYPGWTYKPAYEICGFSIFKGTDRLIAISEQIIAKKLGLEWTPFFA